MTEGLKFWLMGIVVLSVLCAAADSLIPEGGVQKIGRLVCAMAMLCVILRPLSAMRGVDIARYIREYGGMVSEIQHELEQQTGMSQKSVIEKACAAYIADKAEQLGIVCRVEVDCEANPEGVWLPEGVRLWGDFSDAEQSRMTEFLERQMRVAMAKQSYFIPGEAEM